MKIKVVHEFEPIIDENSEILILGSLPSVKSREYNFYYMHPKNRFWQLLSLIYETDFVNCDIERKKELLLEKKIALYDVIHSCYIDGSSDTSITNVFPTDIQKIIDKSNVKNIYLNGRKAYNLFIKFNPELESCAVYLPSTSPANARFSIKKLYNVWEIIKK